MIVSIEPSVIAERIPSLLSTAIISSPAVQTTCYLLSANLFYLARRAHLRQQSMKTMLGYRIDREPGVSIPRYCSFLVAWQCVVVLFPLVEPLLKVLNYCCLYYSYPNAQGFGVIVEPLECQHLPLNKRAKQQIRLDWHRFSVNVGDVGRNGYRHPPAKEMNRPHIDAPRWGIKHWPWRRQYSFKE